ncbi:hypothetical protein FRX31_016259, partial [Thalictrum thalictroides]
AEAQTKQTQSKRPSLSGSFFTIHSSLWPLSLVPLQDCCRSIFWWKVSIFDNFSMSLAVTLLGYCCMASEAEKK